jgi:hypothetical protein
MHLHFNPLGGLAGDMFCAALLDAQPQWLDSARAAVACLAMPIGVSIDLLDAEGTLSGKRFRVTPQQAGRPAHQHTAFRDIQVLLHDAPLPLGVRERALRIFTLLAEAEGKVHGVAPEAVSFHEVGGWDSIADIVSAAALLEALDVRSASCSALPLGGGQIKSAHGLLPVPAPATALLLQGLPVVDDGIAGERVTPTGAAILQSLQPSALQATGGTLLGSGMGFGSRRLIGAPNCLQVLCIEPALDTDLTLQSDQVSHLCFEVDDQSPEDFAVGLEHIRAVEGVLSVTCLQAIGKNGRPSMRVEVLCRPQARAQVAESCFRETTTIGLRHQEMARWLLPRRALNSNVDGVKLSVKLAQRPGGATAKTEMRDLAELHSHAERQRQRAASEAQALRQNEDSEA